MRHRDVACVILASGLSRRFGNADKLSAELCGKPVLSHVLETASRVGFGEIYVVTNRAVTCESIVIANENPEAGQGHALRLGLRAAQKSGWRNCLILLGDMPLVTDLYLKNMILKSNKKQSIVSISESIRMPPVLFLADAMEEILSQSSVQGARNLFDKFDPETVELMAEDALDVDTHEDLARVEQIMKARTI